MKKTTKNHPFIHFYELLMSYHLKLQNLSKKDKKTLIEYIKIVWYKFNILTLQIELKNAQKY